METLAQLGRYKIENLLGSGSYAHVYKAHDPLLNRPVALKVLKPQLLSDEDAFARFIREAQVAATIFHPHIATVLDLGEAEGYYYLAVRYIEGLALDKLIGNESPFPWEKAYRIFSEIAVPMSEPRSRPATTRTTPAVINARCTASATTWSTRSLTSWSAICPALPCSSTTSPAAPARRWTIASR